MPEYEEEQEDDEIGYNPEEEIINEEPEPKPRKRRVVGIIRREQIQQNRPALPREIQPAPSQEYYTAPEPYQPPLFYPVPPRQDQFQTRQTPEQQAKEQAKIQMLFNKEMEREEMRRLRREAMRNKPSFGQHMIGVAYKASYGDNGVARVNKSLGDGLYRGVNVDLPTNKPIKKQVAQKFNQIINNIAPKVSPMITSVNFKSKKKSKR